MHYDPIQMIVGVGPIFMMVSLNGRITKFNPKRHWIGGVIKGGHEVDCLAQRGVTVNREGV